MLCSSFMLCVTQILLWSSTVHATFWNNDQQIAKLDEIGKDMKLIMDAVDQIRNQNTHQKAVTLSILDLLIDAVDNLSEGGNFDQSEGKERTKVLKIARSISRKHRREASALPWDNLSPVDREAFNK